MIPQYAADHHVYSMELSELKEDPDVEHPIHLREGKKYYIYLTRFDSDTPPGYIAVRRYVLDENYGFVEGNGDLIEK